jgi:hypothetical protein
MSGLIPGDGVTDGDGLGVGVSVGVGVLVGVGICPNRFALAMSAQALMRTRKLRVGLCIFFDLMLKLPVRVADLAKGRREAGFYWEIGFAEGNGCRGVPRVGASDFFLIVRDFPIDPANTFHSTIC